MKNAIKTFLFLFFIVQILQVESQVVSGRQKQSTKTVNESKSPFKNARRGGRNTLPRGLKDKKVNIGFNAGLANAGMDLKVEEYAGLGFTGNLYAHYLFQGSPTIGLGFYTNYYLFPVNNRKYSLRYKYPESIKTPNWSIQSFMASSLFNFTIEERLSAQLMTNVGIIYTSIAQTSVQHSDTLFIPSLGYQPVEYSFKNSNSSNIGMTALINFSFAYALSANIEAKAGFEWQYMRVKYNREWYKPEIKNEEIFRQFQSLNAFVGFSINF